MALCASAGLASGYEVTQWNRQRTATVSWPSTPDQLPPGRSLEYILRFGSWLRWFGWSLLWVKAPMWGSLDLTALEGRTLSQFVPLVVSVVFFFCFFLLFPLMDKFIFEIWATSNVNIFQIWQLFRNLFKINPDYLKTPLWCRHFTVHGTDRRLLTNSHGTTLFSQPNTRWHPWLTVLFGVQYISLQLACC